VQPDREKQEGHPDLGQELYFMHVPHRRAESVRPDEDTGGDVAKDQGQPETPGHDPSKQGGHQD
jgi:hypothetical protein